jgi:hypothetical protein
MALAAHQRVLQQGTLLDRMPFMVRYVLIAINDSFLRSTVNHSFLVVAYETTDVQFPHRGLVPVQHGLGYLSCHGICPIFYLREMALKAGEISLDGLIGRLVRPINPLEVRGQKHLIIHAY